MKRPLSRIIVTVACLLMLPFPAAGADDRTYTGGRFHMDLAGQQKGVLEPIDGGNTAAESTLEKHAPAPPAQNQLPQTQRNLQPRPARPQPVVRPAQPLCPNPPCGLGGQREALRDQKDSLNEQSELDQMQLQQEMERRQKANEAASNLMKKSGETQNSITDNLK